MKTITINLSNSLGSREVILEKKRIKKLRLRVYPDGTLKMSVPYGVPNSYVSRFLEEKKTWIENALARCEPYQSLPSNPELNGGSTCIMGNEVRIIVTPAKGHKVKLIGDQIHIKAPDLKDEQALFRQLERWWQKQSKACFEEITDRWYPVICSYGIKRPRLQVRKMRSRWGSCSMGRGKITLNYFLYKSPLSCIEYVVLHELTHFVHPKHDKAFYSFLTLHMPDWQERKKMLEREAAKGFNLIE